MSTSLTKTLNLATKPKRAPPKAKYIDPLVQATFAQSGELSEIVRALSVRLRDDNTTVVFKSLIVLHTLMRSGSLDPTFSYLASSSSNLALASHDAPNIAAYASYLAARIKSYANLKRDVIRDKSDRRAQSRLRSLGVEQGLLREVREVQRMIASLVESKFYLDDIDDDVSMTALRLLVKDLLVLFSAVNEGVINVLEHYFEMSHPDATTALKIYKTFCRDTEKTVAYLGVAKKLHNVLNVQIPNLKHAPVSLVSSLEEYLNDPNFAANREEYKENKRIADGGAPAPAKQSAAPASTSATPASSAATPATPARAAAPTSFTDFFESIESAQTTMFNPSSDSPSTQYFQQQATYNPFLHQSHTGVPFQQPQFGLVAQPTGYQGGNPFLQQQQTGFQPHQQQFLQAQPPPQFMQPQMTGTPNPFRQSMMATGMGGSPFGQQGMLQAQPTGAFAPQQQQHQQPFGMMQAQPTGAFAPAASPFGQPQQQASPFAPQPTGSPFGQPQPQQASPFAPQPTGSPFGQQPPAAPTPQPLTMQKTGTRNPFNPAPGEAPPMPTYSGPSMNALAATAFAPSNQNAFQQQQQQQQAPPPQPTSNGSAFQPSNGSAFQPSNGSTFQPSNGGPSSNGTTGHGFGGGSQQLSAFGAPSSAPSAAPLTQSKTGGLFASVASEFATGPQRTTSPPSFSSAPAFSSAPSFSSSPAFQPTTSSSSFQPTPLRAQSTGFAGSSVKPFQPTSSFGSSLANEFGAAPQQVPQATGTFNPFRSSTLPTAHHGSSFSTGSFSNGGGGAPMPLSGQATGAFVPSSAFGSQFVNNNGNQTQNGNGAFGGGGGGGGGSQFGAPGGGGQQAQGSLI